MSTWDMRVRPSLRLDQSYLSSSRSNWFICLVVWAARTSLETLSMVFASSTSGSLSNSANKPDQYTMSAQAWQIISSGFCNNFPSNTTLFLRFEIAQQIAATPQGWNFFPKGSQFSHHNQHCSRFIGTWKKIPNWTRGPGFTFAFL